MLLQPNGINVINSRELLAYQHQWELEQKNMDDLVLSKVTIESIVVHIQLKEECWGNPFDYVVRHHIKVVHISPRYSACLNLDEEVIARAPIVNKNLTSQ